MLISTAAQCGFDDTLTHGTSTVVGMTLFSLAFFLLFLISISTRGASGSSEADLLSTLLHNSNNVVNPTINSTQPIQVTFGIQLIQIRELDDAQQLLTCKYWVRQSWTNQLIRWDPREWGGKNLRV